MKKSAFTLIETLIAMTILAIVLVAGARLVSSLFTVDQSNRQRFTATYLAQACLEEVRNTRDTNWLQNQYWLQDITDQKSTNFLEKYTTTLTRIPVKDPVETAPPLDEVKITCTVTWQGPTTDQSLAISQILSNWRKK